jgi:SAM-dependent methyltransferase
MSRVGTAVALIRDHPQAWAMTSSVLAEADHDRPAGTEAEDIAHWAGAFDRAVRLSPEGSVALYSLGDPALLRAATDEVAARLGEWGLTGRERVMLDLGCGIGRFVGALAGEMRFIVGMDISHEMLRVARERCADCSNTGFVRMNGRDLSMLADQRFDLVLAADVFPYLFGSGPSLVEAQIAEAARILKPAGSLLILNLSYREDIDADRRDLAAIADRHGLTILRSGTRDFQLWDAQTFHLVKVD